MKTQKTCVVQPRYKQPSIFLFCILWLASLYANIRYKLIYNKQQLKAVRSNKGGMLVLSTHHGPLDLATITTALFPKRYSVVASANIYYKSGIGTLFRAAKFTIPKKQFTTDYSSVRSIRKMLDAGVSVVMYPEARYSIEGRNSRITEATFKLIKWLKVPVVVIKSNMVYQTMPRYSKELRAGKVYAECEVAITAQECSTLSLDQIKERIQSWFTFNDLEYQEKTNQHFKSKRGYAVGLPDLLYKCPKCGAEFAHTAQKNVMTCNVCGNTVEIDGYNAIKPLKEDTVYYRRIDFWYDYQYNELKKEILSNPDYKLTHKIRMARNDEQNCCFTEVEAGSITLDRNGIIYNGSAYPEVKFRIPDPPAMSIDLVDHIDIFADNDDIFRFFFDGDEKPIKLNMALEIVADWCKTASKAKEAQ